MFFVDFSKYHYSDVVGAGKIDSLLVSYLYSVDDCGLLQDVVDNSFRKIVAMSSLEGCSELEKTWKIHDFFIDNIGYFSETINKVGTFEWFRAQSILGVFLDKKAVCTGISKAFKYIMNQIGVRSIVVEGTAINQNNIKEGHTWNIIKIDDNNYHIDITWDVSESENGIRSYNYFNLTDKLIFLDHFTKSNLPVCASEKDNYFSRNESVIHNRRDWDRYFSNSYAHLFGDYYVRIDYPCDLENEIERIKEHIIKRSGCNSLSVEITINDRQRIIRVTVRNG